MRTTRQCKVNRSEARRGERLTAARKGQDRLTVHTSVDNDPPTTRYRCTPRSSTENEGPANHSLLRHERQHKSFKKYKIQVHNKNIKNRALQNREQENPTAVYTEKQKSVNSAQVIRLPLQNSTSRPATWNALPDNGIVSTQHDHHLFTGRYATTTHSSEVSKLEYLYTAQKMDGSQTFQDSITNCRYCYHIISCHIISYHSCNYSAPITR